MDRREAANYPAPAPQKPAGVLDALAVLAACIADWALAVVISLVVGPLEKGGRVKNLQMRCGALRKNTPPFFKGGAKSCCGYGHRHRR